MHADGSGTERGSFLDFRDILALFRQHTVLIWSTVAVGLFVGLTYLLLTPNRYTAVAEVFFETRLQNISGLQAVLPGLTTDRSEIESQIEILGSMKIFDRAAEMLLEDHRKLVRSAQTGFAADLARRLGFGPAENEVTNIVEDLSTRLGRKELKKRLKITRRGLSYLMTIEFTDESPKLAARVANAVADAYIESRRDEKLRATQWASKQLEVRVLKVREEVRKSYAKLQQFKTDNNLFKIKELDLTERQLSDHVDKLSAARDRVSRAEAIVLQTQHLGGDADRLRSLDKVLDSKVILELRGQFARVQRQLSIAEGRYGANHVSVSNARAELKNLNRLINLEIERLVNNSKNELDMARIQVALLERGLEKLKLKYSGRNKARIELAELERQATAKQEIYLALLKRLRETEAEVGMQTDDASITYHAVAPALPSWPKRKLTLGLMLIGSLGIGCAFALVREAFNEKFRTGTDIARLTGYRAVAEFPRIKASASPTATKGDEQAGEAMDPSLVHAREHPESDFTRAVFNLSYWIEHVCAGNPSPIIMVASAHDGDGKTTIASNLAHFSARSGKNVLLIDCDVRSADLTSRLRHMSSKSLVDILHHGSEPDGVIKKLDQTGLSLCPASPTHTPSPSTEVVASSRMSGLLSEVSAQYDLVILDAPALLRSTDMCALLNQVDCTVFVAGAGRTTRQDFDAVLGQTVRYGKNPIGMVLNASKRKTGVPRGRRAA